MLLTKSYTMLEFDKIAEMLKGHCHFNGSSKLVDELQIDNDLNSIKNKLDETESAVSLQLRFGNSPIYYAADITLSVARAFTGSELGMGELLQVARNLKTAFEFKRYISKLPDSEYSPLFVYSDQLYNDRTLEQDIFTKIISEEEMADDASSLLYSLRKKSLDLQNSIKDKLNLVLRSHENAIQEQVITIRSGRYCIPVKLEYKSAVPGIVHDTSSSGQTIFIEPTSVVDTNNKIRELRIQEEQEIERILSELSVSVANVHKQLINNYKNFCILDFIFAKAKLALDMGGIRPDLNDEGKISIINGRHPLIDKKKVVPITFKIGDEYRALIITGPNTGGKTVALKTVGLFTMMIQAGLLVPCSARSMLSVFDEIFADIGDEQSITQNLSTFSAHMKNIVYICEHATNKSLVLMDELGAGTDPTEGAALAMAILKYLFDFGATVVSTTHYSELKIFASTTKGFENASCEFNVDSLKPTYRLLIGVPGKSNAFAISKKIGLDEFIISNAREMISAEDLRFEDMLQNIEKSRQKIEDEERRVSSLRKNAEQIKIEAEQVKSTMDAKREKILADARAEAAEIIRTAKNESTELIKKIRKTANQYKGKEDLLDAEEGHRKITAMYKSANNKLYMEKSNVNHPGEIPTDLKPGDTVNIVSMEQQGEVLKEPDADNNVYLQIGVIKMYVPLNDLRFAESKEEIIQKKEEKYKMDLKSRGIKTELDIRGYNIDEAEIALDKYIDDAHIAHLQTFTVIHGKGTGALRSGVHSYLKRNKYIKSFKLGAYGEGDAGVTIVTLK